MLRRHCKMSRTPLQADDGHAECVSCLGNPHADTALSETDCSHLESFSLASLRSRIALFSESDSAPRTLPPSSSQGRNGGAEDSSSWRRVGSCRLSAHVPRRHRRERIRRSSSHNLISVHLQLRATGYRLMGVMARWMTALLWQLRTQKSYRALWLTPPSCRHPFHATPDPERMRSSSVSWQRLSMSSGSSGLQLRSHLAAGWMSGFSRGAIKPPASARPPSSQKYLRSSLNRGTPPTHLTSVFLLPPSSPPLTALKRRETSTWPLWMSPWPHISAHPSLSDGRKGWAIRPSRAELRLHSLDTYSAAGQAASALHSLWLCSRSSRPRCLPVRRPVSMQLHSGTWEAQRTWPCAPPMPAPRPRAVDVQPGSVGCHIWLAMTERKEVDKVPFLDAPVSSGSLFGPAVEGFVEWFTEAQKSSQAMRHFLPKYTCFSDASSRPCSDSAAS